MIGSHDPAGTNCPRALIAKPTGVCIQLFAAMIQVAEMSVPSATMQVAKKCSRLPTLEMPNSITPRNPAPRKKAVSTQEATSGPLTGPVLSDKDDQLVPNWSYITNPRRTNGGA